MPLTEKTLEFEGPVDFGILMCEDEQDQNVLSSISSISPYTTMRTGDLKCGTTPTQRTLEDVLSRRNKDTQTVDLSDKSSESQKAVAETGLQTYELPVRGFTVDSRIVPGFRYTVRRIGEADPIFDGKARRLLSVGLGYGRRLTFQGDLNSFNNCCFWSDSSPTGFAFNIQAVKEGDVFTIFSSKSVPLGEITIESVENPQIEQETFTENGDVIKNVLVRFTNSIRYFNHHRNLMDILSSQDLNVVQGVAELAKPKGRREATVRCIKNVNLPKVGLCTLEAEP